MLNVSNSLFSVQLQLCASVVWQQHFVALFNRDGDDLPVRERSSALTYCQHLAFVVLHRQHSQVIDDDGRNRIGCIKLACNASNGIAY